MFAFVFTNEKKMYNFVPFNVAIGGKNGDFRTFLGLEKK